VRSDIICFKCGKQGHTQFNCPNSIEKGPQKTAAMQLINETLNRDDQSMHSDNRPHNCDESQGDGEAKLAVITDQVNRRAAVQTTAMRVEKGKPQKPLKVTTVPGLDIGPEQLIEQQKTDQTLKKYWDWLRIQWRTERRNFS